VDHSFELQPAAGVEVPLTDRVALQFVPAEYHLATPSNGATHGYTANLSVSWVLWLQASEKWQLSIAIVSGMIGCTNA
jgi:hypothetical protein